MGAQGCAEGSSERMSGCCRHFETGYYILHAEGSTERISKVFILRVEDSTELIWKIEIIRIKLDN